MDSFLLAGLVWVVTFLIPGLAWIGGRRAWSRFARHVPFLVSHRPVSDGQIYEDLRVALAGRRDLDSSVIHVEVQNGQVLLEGEVQSWDQSSLAQELAASIHGTLTVENRLRAAAAASRAAAA